MRARRAQINVQRLARLLRHPVAAIYSHMLTDYSSGERSVQTCALGQAWLRARLGSRGGHLVHLSIQPRTGGGVHCFAAPHLRADAHGCVVPQPKLVGKRFDELHAYFPCEDTMWLGRVGW